MRFFITEKKLAALVATQLKESTERREKQDVEREAREEQQDAERKARAVKIAQAQVEQDRMLKEMKDFRDVGEAFLCLNYTLVVVRFALWGGQLSYFSGGISPGVEAVCEYRHENGDLMIKEFLCEQLPVMKGGK